MNITAKYFQTLILSTIFTSVSMSSVAESGAVLATVNGQQIDQEVYDAYSSLRARGGVPTGEDETQKKQVLEELINLAVVSQEAKRLGLHKENGVSAQLKLQEQQLLTNHAITKYFEARPISEENIKKAYDEQVTKAGTKEYKARHILVDEEKQAKSLIKKLDAGDKFSELAKTHSTGPSGTKGGELGWVSPNQMVPPFAQALVGIKKGTYGKNPVKTKFGWHVVLVEDTREAAPPALTQIREEIVKSMRTKEIQSYLNDLRKKAKIDLGE